MIRPGFFEYVVTTTTLAAAVFLVAGFVFAQTETSGPAISPVPVTVYDAQRHAMGTGLALIWDNHTLLCSFRLAQKGSFVRVEGEDGPLDVSRVVSYSRYFDFVALRTEGELEIKNPLGSSDAVGVGDVIFVSVRQEDGWVPSRESVHSWEDSGKGYQLIMTEAPAGPFQPSPVYNRDGKEVGWMFSPGKAIPVRDLDRLVSTRSAGADLSEIGSEVSLWEPKSLAGGSAAPDLSTLEPRVLRGTVQFPFQVSLPKNWKFQAEPHERLFVVRAWQESTGLCLELRVISHQDDDLPAAIESTEALLFPDRTRRSLAPYSARRISGFLAQYDPIDLQRNDSIRAFFGMVGGREYVLTMAYPNQWEEQALPFMDRILNSLQME